MTCSPDCREFIEKTIAEHMSYLNPEAFISIHSAKVVCSLQSDCTWALRVDLHDGRALYVPTSPFRRLMSATVEQLRNFQIIGPGQGVHWPDLDEDISIRGFIRHGIFYRYAGSDTDELVRPPTPLMATGETSEHSVQDILGHVADEIRSLRSMLLDVSGNSPLIDTLKTVGALARLESLLTFLKPYTEKKHD